MLEVLLIPIALLYLGVLWSLFIFGLNFYYLTWQAWHAPAKPSTESLTAFPFVTVQLPVYNERFVVERLIQAAAQLDYPHDRFEIQVLDDSSDDTSALIGTAVSHWQALGINIHHLRRATRYGFKAGALAEGLTYARGEFIALFDADFIPPADFLQRALPMLIAQPRTAFVQARWEHLNRKHSLLTHLQSIAIDGHFGIEQQARSQQALFNFNGSAGVWRRTAIDEAGGWTADTLTEDLDLSYRAFLQGWDALYLNDLTVPAEIPATFMAYRRQQQRWATGSLACARKLLPQVWASPHLSWARKWQATLHLTAYGIHLLMAFMALLYPLVLWLAPRYPAITSLFGLIGIFNLAALAPSLLFAVGQKRLGRSLRQHLGYVILLSILGAGMMLNTVRAAWQAWHRTTLPFERTPKSGADSLKESLLIYGLKLDRLVIAEFIFAWWNIYTLWIALQLNQWGIALYAALFASGLFFVSLTSVAQNFRQPPN